MTLTYTEGLADDGTPNPSKDRFESLHSVHTMNEFGIHLIVLTGIVRIDLQGSAAQGWRTEDIVLRPKIIYIPEGKALHVDHWAPFVTLSAISSDKPTNPAGWGIIGFWQEFPRGDHLITSYHPHPTVKTRIMIRDVNDWIIRLGYQITISGQLVGWECKPGDPEYQHEW